jgi:hypothetical protein
MNRLVATCVLVASFLMPVGCAYDTDSTDEVLAEAIQGATSGKWCTSTADCNNGAYCSTETGDCFASPNCRGDLCLAVCYGRCTKREVCGAVLCNPGDECCNESCGICTEPGGVCPQQICEPASSL